MELHELVRKLNLRVITAERELKRNVTNGYAGDLLSDVMANGKPGYIWITLQVHINIVAVACLKEFSAIILVNGRNPESDTIHKAEAEKIPILTTELTSFELIGRLHQMGIRELV